MPQPPHPGQALSAVFPRRSRRKRRECVANHPKSARDTLKTAELAEVLGKVAPRQGKAKVLRTRIGYWHCMPAGMYLAGNLRNSAASFCATSGSAGPVTC